MNPISVSIRKKKCIQGVNQAQMLAFYTVVWTMHSEDDRAFFQQLYIDYELMMFKKALTVLRNEEESLDAVSDACLMLMNETKWRTIQIDAQIDVPDVEKLPVIRVTGTSPVNGLKLLPYSEVVYNEVGQLYVISKDGEPEILGNNEDYKNRYYFADGEIPQIQAEDHPLTAQQAIEMLENKLKGLTGYGKDDFVLGPITVYDRVWKYKKTNGERVYTQPVSKTGEYCIELYQKFAGVQYQSCRECYDTRGKEAWPDAAGVSGAIWDADSFKLWATLLQVVDTPYEDVPILSFGDAKKAIETEIEAGHLRNIDKVQLAYAPYLDPQEKDVFWLLPVWYVKGGYTRNVKKEFEPKYGAGGEIVDDGIERAEVVFEAQKGELMDYNDRSAKRRVVPKIVTWDSVQ